MNYSINLVKLYYDYDFIISDYISRQNENDSIVYIFNFIARYNLKYFLKTKQSIEQLFPFINIQLEF